MVTSLAPGVSIDRAHGGRWTTLRVAGREWLWQRDATGRLDVRPGDPFVDAGGLEECVPTVRGTPDHGDAWSRPWRRVGDADVVDCPEFTLRRRLSPVPDGVRADYTLEAAAGYRFLWAAHALLRLSVGARISLPAGLPVRVYPEAADAIGTAWPGSAPFVEAAWPRPFGLPLGEFGPDDGTAIGASVVGADDVEVIDADDRLRMRLFADPGLPRSVAIWRNLGGFPAGAPYRSVGVEPMLGQVFDRADAGPGDAAVVPASGAVSWRLEITGRPA